MRIFLLFLLLLAFVTLIGCGSATPPATEEAGSSAELGYPIGYPVPSGSNRLNIASTRIVEVSPPEPESATVTGIVISQRTNEPIVEVPIQLAGVYYEGERGAFVLYTAKSPTAITDGQGRFVFVDVEPQDYVLVIGNVEVNDYLIVPEESGRVRVWTAVAGEVLETGSHTILLENWE